jgi:major membrane immunogen (membrane-anchored lipoprotein)
MKLFRYILLVCLVSLLVACSTGDERKQMVQKLGFEIAYQNNSNQAAADDFFIAVKDKTVYYVKVTDDGNVDKILKIIKLDSCDVIAVPVDKDQYTSIPIIDDSKY